MSGWVCAAVSVQLLGVGGLIRFYAIINALEAIGVIDRFRINRVIMTTVQLKSEVNIDVKDLIGGVSELDTRDIEHILAEIGMILAQRKASSLPKRETELLQKIGAGIAEVIQSRYDVLQTKLLAEQITPDEHRELLDLIEIVEAADAERLRYLIELAQLRKVSLDELLSQLGIHHPPAYD